jgi:hypothetical protein
MNRPYIDVAEELSSPKTKPPVDNIPSLVDGTKYDGFEDLEYTLNAHEQNKDSSYTEPFIEEYLSNSSEAKEASSTETRGEGMLRKGVLLSTAVVLVVVIVTVAVALSLSLQNQNSTEMNVSKAISSSLESNVTSASSASPTPLPVALPVNFSSAAAPVAPSVASRDAPPTPAPGSPPPQGQLCITDLRTDKECYEVGETIQVSFLTCGPGPYDWVGLYTEGADDQGRLPPDFFYWEYTCGKREGYCENPPRQGTLSIPANVNPGDYEFYLIAGENPYMALASTPIFHVADVCYYEDELSDDEDVDTDDAGAEWMDVGNETRYI